MKSPEETKPTENFTEIDHSIMMNNSDADSVSRVATYLDLLDCGCTKEEAQKISGLKLPSK